MPNLNRLNLPQANLPPFYRIDRATRLSSPLGRALCQIDLRGSSIMSSAAREVFNAAHFFDCPNEENLWRLFFEDGKNSVSSQPYVAKNIEAKDLG